MSEGHPGNHTQLCTEKARARLTLAGLCFLWSRGAPALPPGGRPSGSLVGKPRSVSTGGRPLLRAMTEGRSRMHRTKTHPDRWASLRSPIRRFALRAPCLALPGNIRRAQPSQDQEPLEVSKPPFGLLSRSSSWSGRPPGFVLKSDRELRRASALLRPP